MKKKAEEAKVEAEAKALAQKKAELTLKLPTDGRINTTDIPEGIYSLKSITTTFSGTESNILAGFRHVLTTAGVAHGDDQFDRFADWGSLDRKEDEFYVTHYFNLLKKFSVGSDGATYTEDDETSYWQQIRSTEWAGWQMNHSVRAGVFVYFDVYDPEFFDANTTQFNSKKVMKVGDKSVTGVIRMNGTSPEFWLEVVGEDDRVRVVRMTYEKAE